MGYQQTSAVKEAGQEDGPNLAPSQEHSGHVQKAHESADDGVGMETSLLIFLHLSVDIALPSIH